MNTKIKYIGLLIIFSLLSVVFFNSCKKISKEKQSIALKEYAAFDWFKYEGKDTVYNTVNKDDNEYYNPVLAGFYPDPSICRVDDKFYLITSSFAYFPGIPIFESTDLVNWTQIGHVIHRKEQADFTGVGVSRGMFAPTIRYNNGTFYVICTNVDAGGNFIVTAKNPEGPWSDPIWIKDVNGIDPDIFFDDDGKVYITHNGPPPNNISLHDGHRAIYMFEYNIENQQIVGDSKLVVNGGTDMAKKPVWIEAPHIFKKDGFYYLICAEGGTAFNHSEVVFRSKNIFGPYEVYKNNPILTQRHLDSNRENQVTTAGHADFVELPNGEWWSVFLACRPYGDDLYNIGRETFLMPVEWNNGWPTIVGGNNPIPVKQKKPNLPVSSEVKQPSNGNFTVFDDFNEDELSLNWNFIRTPLKEWHKLNDGKLLIKPRKENIHTKTNYSFIGRRQQHFNFEASTKLSYKITDDKQAVGLVVFQNEDHYLFLGKRLNEEGKQEVFLQQNAKNLNEEGPKIITKAEIENTDDLFLKIEGKTSYYNFYYKTSENDEWNLLANEIDGTILSTKVARGFVGAYLSMYASLNHF